MARPASEGRGPAATRCGSAGHRVLARGAAAHPARAAPDLVLPGLRPRATGQRPRSPGWQRGLATSAVFTAIGVAVVLFVIALGSLLVSQVAGLIDAIPGYAQQAANYFEEQLGPQVSGGDLAEDSRRNEGVQDFVGGVAAGAIRLSAGRAGLPVHPDGRHLSGRRPASAHRAAERPVDAIWVLLYIVVYQQFENIVLPPRITARTMALHPEVAFGAVIAGGAIMGPIESPLALPAAASVQAVVSLYVDRYEVVADPLIAAPDPSAVPADAPPGPERE